MSNLPVPKDFPLPLPAPEGFLQFSLVLLFLLHILFVYLMVGGTFLALYYQIRSLSDSRYDWLARKIAHTLTVNKSIAVVLGVGPLLVINSLYSTYFYAANALTGNAWMSLIPLIALAFLLIYLHKYSWDALSSHRRLHIGLLSLAALIFVFVPLVFVTNVNLMLFPQSWMSVKGFWSAAQLPSVAARYLHFICASMSASALFMLWQLQKSDKGPFPLRENNFRFLSLLTFFLSVDVVIAIFTFMSSPLEGLSSSIVILLACVLGFALSALFLTSRSLLDAGETVKPPLKRVSALLILALAFYGALRHGYRESALAKHKALVSEKTQEFQKQVRIATLQAERKERDAAFAGDPGEIAFKTNCAPCHAMNEKLVGPPVTEIVSIYGGRPEGIVAWAMNPGKKRPDYPSMPSMKHVGSEQLEAIARYLSSLKP